MNAPLESILLDHSSGILLLIDPVSLTIRAASKPTLGLLGYDREQLLGKSIAEIECSLSDALFWEEVRQGGPAELRGADTSYRCANGAILSASKSITRVNGGAENWLVVRADPMQARRRINDRFAPAAPQLRATLEATADGILLVDCDGRIVNMNRQFAQMWGLPDELLLEQDEEAIIAFMAELFPDPDAYRYKLAQIAADAEGETFDLLRLTDGRCFERTSRPAHYGANTIGRVFSFTDVSARERMQEALKTSEERFRKAFDVSPDAININRITDGLYVLVNRGFTNLTGYSSGEIVGRPSIERTIWAHEEDRKRLIQELKENGTVTNFEAEFRIKSGEIRTGLMYASLIEINGETHLISITRDITERKQAELTRAQLEWQLRESQKMEALGTLAGGVAHDFNNIVAAILGNAELARLDIGPTHPARASIEEILKASRRAKDLVQQILAFGRRQVIERRVISLAPVVEESVHLLRSSLSARVSLRVECAPDAPTVLADATQVQRVLLNLCANAWQAVQGRAQEALIEVRLEAYVAPAPKHERAPLGAVDGRAGLRPGRYACLTVRDNGPGMNAAIRARIFEPFFTTKPAGEGTGLGLAVVHGIVQEHKGSIEVQSAPGQGASFSVYFPEAAAAPAATSPRASVVTPEHGRGKHIVCVDDDESIAFLMTRLLERQGYRVSAYTDPHEAIAAVRAAPADFDLVVTDYNMPGLSGLEVARALREIRADLPVALASGYITEEMRAEAPVAGVVELIYKPNTVEELCVTVARLAHAQKPTE